MTSALLRQSDRQMTGGWDNHKGLWGGEMRWSGPARRRGGPLMGGRVDQVGGPSYHLPDGSQMPTVHLVPPPALQQSFSHLPFIAAACSLLPREGPLHSVGPIGLQSWSNLPLVSDQAQHPPTAPPARPAAVSSEPPEAFQVKPPPRLCRGLVEAV